jgi:hypothetical protein
MSKVGSIMLLGDSAVALPGFDSKKTPYIAVKTGEVIWNGMQCEEPSDGVSRRLFTDNAEINATTSGLIENPRWRWADFLAEQSIECDAMFIFAPHATLFPQQHSEILKSLVLQKTHYSEFFRRHQRKTGKLKTFEIKTDNWFAGVGLVIWQCQQILSKLDPEKAVSLSQLKSAFEQLSKRTRTISIMSTQQISPVTRKQILDESFLGRLTGSLGKSKWVSFQLGYQQSDSSDKDSFQTQLDAALKSMIAAIEGKKLGFSRIVISCNTNQLAQLKNNATFLQFDKMQKAYGYKWVHQPAAISSQILTGKDAVHFSYAIK